ncbi:MAG: Fe-S cluster assembly protein SufD [Pseudomonadota bacterium]
MAVSTMGTAKKIELTDAENALVESFVDRLGRLPGNADTVQARDNAISTLKKNGLPTRKIEAFHYTHLRGLLKSVPDRDHSGHGEAVSPLVSNAELITLNNGRLGDLPEIEGVQMTPVSSSLQADVGALSLGPVEPQDAVGMVNTAFLSDGVTMSFSENLELETPIEIQSIHGGGQTHTRNVAVFDRGAKATVFDRYIGDDSDVLTSNITQLTVKAGADVTWIRVQDQGSEARHLGRVEITLDEGAKLTLFVMNFSGKLVREEIHAKAMGEGADLTFRSINMLNGESHCDVTLELDHLVENTTSTETVRNVITDRAQGVFQGQIRVAQIAQKTDAQMACNTLVLSDDARIAVKPELEIFADDVICAHGATVTEIDSHHLFYLMARGITEKSGRGLLVKAFVAEIVEELENEELIDALEARIDQWLETHG